MASQLTSSDLRPIVAERRTVPWRSYSTWCLLAIGIAALVLRVFVAYVQHISYDGWWHVWIATQDRWKIAVAEYRANAHPPLFYLILRVLHVFGSNQWIYRTATIVPGALATLLVGLIVRRLTHNAVVASLTALALGSSRNAIEISTDLRTYSLCICLVLLAFYFYVDLLSSKNLRANLRSLLGFSVCTTLAIASEYYAVFFFISCLLTIAALALMSAPYRRALGTQTLKSKWAVLAALALPLLVLQYLYRTHIKLQPSSGYGHISEYYWDSSSHESALAFLVRNGQSVWNTFTVFPVHNQWLFLACVIGVITLAVIAVIWASKNGFEARVRVMAPTLILMTLLLQIMAFSLARKYPFGGLMRQQSIIMPFIFVTTGVVCCVVLLRVPQMLRNVLLVAVGAALMVNFRLAWREISWPGWDEGQAQFDNFVAHAGNTDGVILDQFDLIIYYAHMYDWHWKFDKRVTGPTRFDTYLLSNSTGRQKQVVRTKDWWNFQFSNPKFYSDISAVLHSTSIHHLAVFCNLQGVDQFAPAARQKLFNDVDIYSHTAGLSVDTLATYGGEVTAAFSLNKPAQ